MVRGKDSGCTYSWEVEGGSAGWSGSLEGVVLEDKSQEGLGKGQVDGAWESVIHRRVGLMPHDNAHQTVASR